MFLNVVLSSRKAFLIERPDKDDELILRIAGGDQVAFRYLTEKYTRRMLALAEQMTNSSADADDIVQDVFLKVWTVAPNWQPGGPAQFTTWLHRVVVNACLDRRRRTARLYMSLDEIDDLADESRNGFDSVLAEERDRAIRAAISDLPDRQRAAVSLFYYCEMTAPQVAHVLELSVPTVESLLVRGKRGLKKTLIQWGVAGIFDVL
jgi:RNA polymerase sigma-70 factor (ECF subfamily)